MNVSILHGPRPILRSKIPWRPILAGLGVWLATACVAVQAQFETALPPGVKVVWDLDKAYRTATPSRERVCLNGLWRWQPGSGSSAQLPNGNWGFFKVPGCWPGTTDYMQKDSQLVFSHPSWKDQNIRGLSMAWYEREISVPAEWSGRRIALSVENLNSLAAVFVDGKRAGELRFPAGELDLTGFVRPGGKHRLTLFTKAVLLKEVMLAFTDTFAAKEVRGSVARRGLCGDVFLVSSPDQARITNVKVDPSFRQRAMTIHADLAKLANGASYRLAAKISYQGLETKTLASPSFQSTDLKNGRFSFSSSWLPEKLWDLHTPQNQYDLELSLTDGAGRGLDDYFPTRFGFREFWIDGPDFKLNGTRIFWAGVPLDNAQIGAAAANYEAAKETLLRLRSIGLNMVYAHNYDCAPGSHLGFEEILRAADDVGMLVALTQPHFGQYDWNSPDAARTNGYSQIAASYVRVAQNHPSVIAYATSHNSLGDGEMMNPERMDGVIRTRDQWSGNNARKAGLAESIIRELDPSRIVYHHSGGDFGAAYTCNFYINFVPIQERSDWFEHWAAHGVKPLFLCEFGMPYFLDWTMYRGWYKGERAWGSASVPFEFCLAEWNAQWLGDRAFQISEMEKKNLRWEAPKFRAGQVWHHWDYPAKLYSPAFEGQQEVLSRYTADNWRAFRTAGVSGTSPWNFDWFWQCRDGVDRNRRKLPVDWDNLQRPGFSPDFIEQQYERMDLAFERADWTPTSAGVALLRNNRPLLAYLGGKSGAFTEKGHNFIPGETIEKQVIIVNNCRETVEGDCSWSLDLPVAQSGYAKIVVPTGEIRKRPLTFALPADLKPGIHKISLSVKFGSRESQEDSFTVHVLPKASPSKISAKLAIFDPLGATIKQLKELGVRGEVVGADADLSKFDVLVVGQRALQPDGPALDLSRVADGLKVLVFEQTREVLEQRFGFRVQEYGLRNVFKRVPDHPLLAGLDEDQLRDWRGAATLLPTNLTYEMRPRYGPTITNLGMKVTRPWRAGHRGNVASVLIEKPACGDFLPLLDGGFSLQYSPLLEYREGRGVVVFCQLDVTSRTEEEPAAARLTRNLLEYLAEWQPLPRRTIIYAGDPAGRKHLEESGFAVEPYSKGALENPNARRSSVSDKVLVVGPGGGKLLAPEKQVIADWLKRDGRAVALALEADEARLFLPTAVETKKAEHIAAYFGLPARNSPLAGVGPADVHSREPRVVPLIAAGAEKVGDGVLAVADEGRVVFCQLAPWQFNAHQQNTKRTFRRTSSLLARLLGNLGVASQTPLLSRFSKPLASGSAQPVEERWRHGFYLDEPEEWDDPYRYFQW